MGEYSEECLRTFLKDQGQLFDEPVAETRKRQKHFWKTAWQLLWIHWRRYAEYFEESGADVDHMTEERWRKHRRSLYSRMEHI